MLSVHTTKFCSQLFQELLGKVSMLRTFQVALTPPPCFQCTPFTFCFDHWQRPFSAELQCSHRWYITSFQTKPLVSLCLSGDCSYDTDTCLLARILCKQGGCLQQPLQLYLQKGSLYTHRHNSWYAF